MKAPLSWIKDYVDLEDLSIEEIARYLTMTGLEVDSIQLVGLPKPEAEKHEFKYAGLSWDSEKFVVAQVEEVMPHPNADKLVLCRLNDGKQELIVLTGAPNLYPFTSTGPLFQPLKVAYAREGAQLYDGHQPGQVLTKLKRMSIRGVESFSMICSEKELGISDEHDGVILLDSDAPLGVPLVDYLGDAVFEISILPNMARDASIIGIARELAAVTKRDFHPPQGLDLIPGEELEKMVGLEIRNPEINPRFMLGMAVDVKAQPSPYWVQYRLNLAGMRPIDALVDATNYTMLDTGEPLHAFDYDSLLSRNQGKVPKIITRLASEGEQLTTLDGNTHVLDNQMELVCDAAGPLSLAGIMGGSETGINSKTGRVLLEAASWNFINIRRTVSKLKIASEAAWRFSRSVHPNMAEVALRLCLERVLNWAGGRLVQGVLDQYPNRKSDPIVELSEEEIRAALGTTIPMPETVEILSRLGFECRLDGNTLSAKTPPTRMDIEEGLIGKANLIEEISRIYGYDRIPSARLKDELPSQTGNFRLEVEELIRDILVSIGLQDTVAYRQTSPEREARIYPEGKSDPDVSYVRIINPITPDRTVMRRSSLATMLELVEYNSKFRPALGMFELGPVFLPIDEQQLPEEALRLSIAITGLRDVPTWQKTSTQEKDFFDLKGIVEALLNGLHINNFTFVPAEEPSFHPGKCARIVAEEDVLGVMGEVHPVVSQHYSFGPSAVLVAELNADLLIKHTKEEFHNVPISSYPNMMEDIAIIVDENTPAAALEKTIAQAGGKLLVGAKLFDIFQGEKIGSGKKSMAYQLTYQAYDRTLTDKDAETIRNRVVRTLSREFGAVLRSQ